MKKRDAMPPWVYIALLGINSRVIVWVYINLCILGGLGGLVTSLYNPLGWLGLLFFPVAGWYFAALRWMDQRDAWVIPSPTQAD